MTLNLFEMLSDRYVLPPKPRLFESFAGIGCQRMAFDRLGIDYESVGISEIDKYAIKSYMAIHGETKNYGDITKINGYQLPTIDVFTYSFPCTDLSKAGKQKGLNATRSGLVYEVLRILQELKDLHNLPSVLIMENVVDLVQTKFIREFNEIQLELESLGYSNYVETMNAKDYGVAQNRDRVFMVSILGDYYYEFPKKIKLEKRLKDYLESEVDEKYYLSESFVNAMYKDSGKFNRAERFEQSIHSDLENDTAFTVTSRAGGRPTDNFIKEPKIDVVGNLESSHEQSGRIHGTGGLSPTVMSNSHGKTDGGYTPIKIVEPQIGYAISSREFANTGWQDISPTLLARDYKDPKCVKIQEATEQGYSEAYEGDSINLAQPNSKTRRGRVGKQVSQTLTTMNQIAVVEPIICASRGRENGQEIEANKSGLSNALTTVQKDNMVVEPNDVYLQSKNGTFGKLNEYSLDGYAPTIPASCYKEPDMIRQNLRIRKLTPLECWRLMGIDDECFYKASEVNSNSQLYKQAGNGIVVDVFAAIIKNLKG